MRLPGLVLLLLVVSASAPAQTPRTRVFTTAHDFLSDADTTRGLVVVEPGTDSVYGVRDRLSNDDASLRLPTSARPIDAPNLVRPDVTVDSSAPGYTAAPITDGRPFAFSGTDAAGFVWRSQDVAYQHHVDLHFHDGPRTVSALTIDWGAAGGPSAYKIQIENEDGWLVDLTSWRNGTGAPGNAHSFIPPRTTRRVRVTQDLGAGAGSSPNVMTVAELEVATTGTPVTFPVRVDSSYPDYAPSYVADGDKREGTTAYFWTEVWVSADSPAQHWIDVELGEPRVVARADVHWGRWGSARFKVQYWTGTAFADTSTSAGTWLDGGAGPSVSRVAFAPVVTTRVRLLQDGNGGIPPPDDPNDTRVGLMSVAELGVFSAQSYTSGLLSTSADSSYPGYVPSALIDGVRTETCPPSACDGPGQLWVSAETPVEHWAELRLGQLMWVGRLDIDWGAWGSTSFTVRSWNGINWVDHATMSADSNEFIEVPIGVHTDRLRIVQPAGAGAGRPLDGFVRPNLMSIGELAIAGHRGRGSYVSAPIRLADPAALVTLTATQSGVGGGQTASYALSTDDGATWTAVTPGDPIAPPPGDRLRWRVELVSPGMGTPEVSSVQLAITGSPQELAPALWRSGRAGAVTVGVDDSRDTLLLPGEQLLLNGLRGTPFLQTLALPGFALLHELALHTVSHGCAWSPPDGASGNSLLTELTNQTNTFDPYLPARGRLQSLAWPCGNYDLAKGSLGRRFVVSARGFRDGDPGVRYLCMPSPADDWACAHPEGEPMELLEEPTPRNFMNLRGIAIDEFRWPELTDAKHVVAWAEQSGDWANFVYHAGGGPGYQGEVEEMLARDVWVAPQGEVVRYIRLRDAFAFETIASSASSRDFRVATTLTPADVPEFNHALASYPLGEVVERVFDGGVTARVHSPPARGTPLRALVWGNGAAIATRSIEGNRYVLFDTPLAPAATPIHVDWVSAGDADADGVPNATDNCTWRANGSQSDLGGVLLAGPNRVGDRCECGDVANDGDVDAGDVVLLRSALAGSWTLVGDAAAKCSVIDAPGAPTCDIADLAVLRRRFAAPRPLLPGTFPVCAAARP